MKVIEGEKYYRIGEVAKLVERTAGTIRNWYQWAEYAGETERLPVPIRIGPKGIRYWKQADVLKLLEFRDKIGYGTMSEYNEKLWGKRNIQTKKSREFPS